MCDFGNESPVEFFCGLNVQKNIVKKYDVPVITFSHFLPLRKLLPEKQYLTFKALPKVSGSNSLNEQIKLISPIIHVSSLNFTFFLFLIHLTGLWTYTHQLGEKF